MLNLVMNTVFLSYKTEEGYTTCSIFFMRDEKAFSDQDPGPGILLLLCRWYSPRKHKCLLHVKQSLRRMNK